jgi:drug/metabolite transporter (DMT)-like permease
LRTFACTAFALVAFAANSVLCRLALDNSTIDPASFSTIRLVSGAAVLWLISRARDRKAVNAGDWVSAALLFLYAAPFAFAYVTLTTGTGALILFGSVQTSMILAALRSGERLHGNELLGLLLGLGGLVYLVFPGLSAPTPLGSALMAGAGVSWGLYSLRGRRSSAPLAATANNFVRSVPLTVAMSLILLPSARLSLRGSALALLSGTLTSGIGYAVWYAALRGLATRHASIVQLSVPVLAAMGGVLFLSEPISLRLLLSACMILGGVGLAVLGRKTSGR